MKLRSYACLTLLALLFGQGAAAAQQASFLFGNGGVRNVVSGQASADLTDGGYTLTLEAGPAGAVLNDTDSDGLGINTRGIPGVVDGGAGGEPSKFNIIDGASPVTGDGEQVTLRFDRPGILTGLLFDGLKDETLEYFLIELPGGSLLSFFDFEVGFRLGQQGFSTADLSAPNVVLATGSDDDLRGLAVPFNSGDEIKLTYAEIDFTTELPGYSPIEGGTGNGARFEGVTVIPEPAGLLLVAAGALAVSVNCRRR